MVKKSVVLALLAAGLSTPAWSQISIYLGIAPPPVRFEPPPPPPAPAYLWIPGFWAPEGGRYLWVAGRYERPPYPGAFWYGPHYDQGPRGWGYRRGYWGRRQEVREEHGRGHAYGHYKDWDDDDHDHGHGHEHGHDRD